MAVKKINIDSILEALNTSECDYNHVLDMVFSYYENEKRHSYNEITEYMIMLSACNHLDDANIITENIDFLKRIVSDDCECTLGKDIWTCNIQLECEHSSLKGKLRCYQGKTILRGLSKLYDHILMEYLRLTQIANTTENIQSKLGNFERDYKYISEQLSDTFKYYTDLKNESEIIKNRSDEIKEQSDQIKEQSDQIKIDLDKSSKDIYLQIVSILSIFSAVIIATFGGMNAFNFAFQNIENLWQLVFTLCVGLIFVFNLVFLILVFVTKLFLKDKVSKSIWIFCGMFDSVLFVGALYSIYMLASLSAGA